MHVVRALRRDATDAEHRLWKQIRTKQMGGWKFRRQHGVGRYIVDFACMEAGLIIEIDGGQHTSSKDAARTTWLEAQGLTAVRFWNDEVLRNTEGVVSQISDFLARARPSSNPSLGGRGISARDP
jgi:very-short-patch-repair endonuclease